MRVAVLASGEGTNLQALLDTVHGREAQVVAVASDQLGAPALGRARAAGVPGRVFALGDFADRAARDAAVAAWLQESGTQLVVLAGYMALLDAAFIDRFRDRIINVHPSLLPAFAGLGAVEQALAYGVKVAGVTVHFVDEGVDSGAVILQRAVEVGDTADPGELLARLRPLEHDLLPRAVRLIAQGAVRRDPGHPRRVVVAGDQ